MHGTSKWTASQWLLYSNPSSIEAPNRDREGRILPAVTSNKTNLTTTTTTIDTAEDKI